MFSKKLSEKNQTLNYYQFSNFKKVLLAPRTAQSEHSGLRTDIQATLIYWVWLCVLILHIKSHKTILNNREKPI